MSFDTEYRYEESYNVLHYGTSITVVDCLKFSTIIHTISILLALNRDWIVNLVKFGNNVEERHAFSLKKVSKLIW